MNTVGCAHFSPGHFAVGTVIVSSGRIGNDLDQQRLAHNHAPINKNAREHPMLSGVIQYFQPGRSSIDQRRRKLKFVEFLTRATYWTSNKRNQIVTRFVSNSSMK